MRPENEAAASKKNRTSKREAAKKWKICGKWGKIAGKRQTARKAAINLQAFLKLYLNRNRKRNHNPSLQQLYLQDTDTRCSCSWSWSCFLTLSLSLCLPVSLCVSVVLNIYVFSPCLVFRCRLCQWLISCVPSRSRRTMRCSRRSRRRYCNASRAPPAATLWTFPVRRTRSRSGTVCAWNVSYFLLPSPPLPPLQPLLAKFN